MPAATLNAHHLPDLHPPRLRDSLMEVPRVLLEMSSSALLKPMFRVLPRGDGHSVMTLPGFFGADGSTAPLRRFLTRRNYAAHAREMGADIQSVRQVRAMGTDGMLARIPEGARYYVTIDIDAFDPSIAPGTGTPSHGGFIYYEVLELLAGLAKRGEIVGVDLVEVAPDYDPTGSTSTLAAQLLMNLIGRILHARKQA